MEFTLSSYLLYTTFLFNFKVGDIVTFEGKLVLNKDFGYGYKYDYLVEKATIK